MTKAGHGGKGNVIGEHDRTIAYPNCTSLIKKLKRLYCKKPAGSGEALFVTRTTETEGGPETMHKQPSPVGVEHRNPDVHLRERQEVVDTDVLVQGVAVEHHHGLSSSLPPAADEFYTARR